MVFRSFTSIKISGLDSAQTLVRLSSNIATIDNSQFIFRANHSSHLIMKLSWNISLFVLSLAFTYMAKVENVLAANMVKQVGNVRAEVTFKKDNYSLAKDVRVKILRNDKVVLDEVVSPQENTYSLRLSVQDLDGDKEPEIIFTHNPAMGQRCCTTSRIYGYRKNEKKYTMVMGEWKGAGTPQIKDLDGDGKYEFEYNDWRFAYAFTVFANSVMPIRIWQYRQGNLDEATYKYPQAIKRDIAKGNEWHQQLVHEKRDLKGSFAAYAAEKYLLGEGEAGLREIQKSYEGDDKQEFLDKLNEFLKGTGYTSLPSK
jgi:hypothetical protein